MSRRKRPNSSSKDENTKPEVNSSETSVKDETSGLPDKKSSKTNDPEWYNRDPRLALDGASIPFSVPFGSFVNLVDNITGTTPTGKTFSNNYVNRSIPGICSLIIKPSFGSNTKKTDPVNVCANALYTHVRYVNSGRKNYDPADLFIYTAAFGDIYSFIMWAERIYAYAFMYSQRNWYVGKHLIQANGVNADSIITNLANFRYWINTVINKVSSFCLPGDIYYFKRRAFMFANYYIENPYGNIKDQLYQFVPEGFYRFEVTGNTGAGALRYLKITDYVQTGNPLTYQDFATIFDSMMQNITGDEDFGLMSGDILKAYGSNIIGLPQLGEEASIMPVYDPYVLSQFKNANIVSQLNRADPSKTFNIGTDPYNYIYGDLDQSLDGLLISKEACTWASDGNAGLLAYMNKWMTVENPDPGVGDVLEASRLMLGYDQDEQSWECGTEIVVDCALSYIVHQYPVDMVSTTAPHDNFTYASDPKVGMNDYEVIHPSFKYAPLLLYVREDGAGMYDAIRIVSNVDNITTVTNDILKRLHEIALLSLFYVPGVAKLIS